MTQRQKLLRLPILVVPLLCLLFYSLGGGKGKPGQAMADAAGFNAALPDPRFDKQKQALSKLDLYKQADQDSIRRREYQRQDPNFQKRGDSSRRSDPMAEDRRADELLRRLDKLKQSIQQPTPPQAVQHAPLLPPLPVRSGPAGGRRIDTVEEDPELEKLNGMLDKIIRIQHPPETGGDREAVRLDMEPDTAVANSLPAVTQESQVLVAGATIALRLTAEATINGLSFPKDQLLYGVVSINNDRMLISIHSIRREQGIYPVGLQVYDLDGLPGIHIPGSLGRETVKQTADQSINSMGLVGFDASPVAQVTNAGVMAARSLLSRKVRLVRVTVPAGYQLLLRNAAAKGRVQVVREELGSDHLAHAPTPGAFIPFLRRAVRRDRMELMLQGIYLQDSLLWILLRLENHSAIAYNPGYMRWCVRDRRRGKRTAFQELAMEPLYTNHFGVIAGDSGRVMVVGFRPFALPRDKELVLLMAEGNGARELVLTIEEKELLKLRKYDKEDK